MSLKKIITNVVFINLLIVFANNIAIASVITGASANVVVNTLPADIQLNSVESNDNIFVFSENKNTLLGSDLLVNFTGTGFYQPASTNEAASSFVSAGSIVDSYLLHLDSVENLLVRQEGFITFDTVILGIIGSFNPLIVSDALLGIAGAQYEITEPGFGGRGMEGLDFGAPVLQDSISISGDGRTLGFDLGVSTWFDNVRIVTASSIQNVPEPSTLLLFLVSAPLLLLIQITRIQKNERLRSFSAG